MPELIEALGRGDPDEVAALIAAGHDIHYTREHGYRALVDAIHCREGGRDARLIDLLSLLIAQRVDLNALTDYNESGLRVLSRLGRFDAVRLLLDAGADEGQLAWTPLMRAVALGTLDDVRREIDAGAALEATDWWHRTAFAIACLTGDVAKMQLLFDRGANADVAGRIAPPLFYAIDGRHADAVRWLLDVGADVDQMDDSGMTALMHAAAEDHALAVDLLVSAGADVNRDAFGTALQRARSRAVVERLLAAGADPQGLTNEARRVMIGLPPDPEERLLDATLDEFRRAQARRFGTANPEPMNEPFWLAMIRSGVNAWAATQRFDPSMSIQRDPIWCAQRFGQSLTCLPDGRIVLIGGEHEDHYDPDFCIYNDVFVRAPDGTVTIFGYPESVFPPTDFHTATLAGDAIYVIGSLGYHGARRFGETPVFRLDLATFRMERLETSGDAPGWIYRHRADLTSDAEIRVRGGMLETMAYGKELPVPNPGTFVLDVTRLTWRRMD